VLYLDAMIKVYTCLAARHDPWTVVLAVVVCLLSSGLAMGLLDRIGKAAGLRRAAWLGLAATVAGVGVWATHFIAILGFRSGLPVSYDPAGTLASLLAAVVLMGFAIHVAVGRTWRPAPLAGGALAGGAIAVMHYTGMAAFWIEGHKLWSPGLVVASLALGTGFGALSFLVALRAPGALKPGLLNKAAGAVLLTAAVCGLHFTGLSAVSVVPDPSLVAPARIVSNAALQHWAASAAFVLLMISLAALLVGYLRRLSQSRRLRELAEASVEGLAVCDGDMIIAVNASLARMAGLSADNLAGRPFASLFAGGDGLAWGALSAGLRLEAPLRSASGETIPVELLVHALSFDGKPRLAIAVRDLRERAAAEAKMRFLAHHDGLTGLPNRLTFDERLTAELQRHRRKDDTFGVLYLDLDRFKPVNDTFGHAAGDLVLQTVVARIKAALGEGDFLARLGGDEFAVICLSVSRPADIARLCERVLAGVSPEIEVEGHAATVGVSIGIALYPEDGETAALLERNADVALYQAKSEGRGAYRFFEASLGAKLREREALELDLRRAMTRGELSVAYQPQVSTHTREVFGFEALVRWTSPTRGAVPPHVFVPLAEEAGLIGAIGDWVLREACGQAARWRTPLQIAVNVSGVQLRSAALSRRVEDILLEVGLAPDRLELEITETALIEDFDRALRTLRELKALGVKVAMDDFGTGYSSLSNLRAFPFDKIKIDRSFVRDVHENGDGATIVRAIVGLCHGLGLAVLAEGVETVEELQFLDEENCPQAQGFLFGYPGAVQDFPALCGADILPLRDPRLQAGSRGS
jgi:diguanylate cyclase (GGDEF)-like protein/PAS domain S-box-containing protein